LNHHHHISLTSYLRKCFGWSSITSTMMISLWVMSYLWDCWETSTKFYFYLVQNCTKS
jgi:hypothetical protein